MVRLSALRTGPLYPLGNTPGTDFCSGLSRHQGHSAAERTMSMKKFNDTIGNRARDIPACGAVPEAPTAPPRTPEAKAGSQISCEYSVQIHIKST